MEKMRDPGGSRETSRINDKRKQIQSVRIEGVVFLDRTVARVCREVESSL